jgi:uncharacterized membrane protein
VADETLPNALDEAGGGRRWVLIVDGLYALAPLTFGVSALIGLAIAFARRNGIDAESATQHRRQLRLFAVGIFAASVGLAWIITASLTAPREVPFDGLSADAQELGMAGATILLLALGGFWVKALFDLVVNLARPEKESL